MLINNNKKNKMAIASLTKAMKCAQNPEFKQLWANKIRELLNKEKKIEDQN
jgi:hypothetical protein